MYVCVCIYVWTKVVCNVASLPVLCLPLVPVGTSLSFLGPVCYRLFCSRRGSDRFGGSRLPSPLPALFSSVCTGATLQRSFPRSFPWSRGSSWTASTPPIAPSRCSRRRCRTTPRFPRRRLTPWSSQGASGLVAGRPTGRLILHSLGSGSSQGSATRAFQPRWQRRGLVSAPSLSTVLLSIGRRGVRSSWTASLWRFRCALGFLVPGSSLLQHRVGIPLNSRGVPPCSRRTSGTASASLRLPSVSR
jgi:hypothetical protein